MPLKSKLLDKRIGRGMTFNLVLDVVQSDREIPPQFFLRLNICHNIDGHPPVRVSSSSSADQIKSLFPKYADMAKFNLCRVTGTPPNVFRNGIRFFIGSSDVLREKNKTGNLTLDKNEYFKMFCDLVRIEFKVGRSMLSEAEGLSGSPGFDLNKWLTDWLSGQLPRWNEEFNEMVDQYSLKEFLS